MNLRQTFTAALLLASTTAAFADVKINDHLSINGYAVGAATTTDLDGAPNVETYFDNKGSPAVVNADAVKLGLLGTIDKISAYGSILYLPGLPNEAGLLDAYVTFDTGAGFKITGGKFLSYLGYEAFDPVNMAQLTYANTIFAIPAYHSGAKIDYATKTFSVGLAVTDSLFMGSNGFFEGDREFDDDVAVEAVMTYTGIEKLTIFAGIGTEDTHGAADDTFVFDLWASYALTDKVTIAGEYDVLDNVGQGWLAFLSYKFSDQFSTAFRVSGANWDAAGVPDDHKYTIAPTLTLTPNFALRAEVSKGESGGSDFTFYGVQGIIKW